MNPDRFGPATSMSGRPRRLASRRFALRAAWLPCVCALLLAGCAVGPDYQRPALALPAAFKEAPAGWKNAEPADVAARGEWWRGFGDPTLDGLVKQLHDANQNLRVAEANWRRATALGRQARAALYPSVGVQAGGTRAQNSGNGPIANTVQVAASADWEADLWGGLRRNAESQEAAAQASDADLANTRLSLEAELAADYVALRVADAQSALYAANVASYEASLRMTRNRLAAGVATPADVAQAETQWLSARAQAVDVEINRAQLEHAIAVLTGHAPAEFSLAVVPMSEPGQLALAVPAVPGELPSGLLERRPDVAAAERRAAAANASIGVARAALFPTLTLSATGGYKGTSASNLFDVAHRFWTLGPALALTVFDAGARRAQVDQAEAAYDAAAGTYRQTVLGALQDVEDALVALRVLDGEAQLQAQTVRAAGVSLQLALNQYRAGTIGYLNVVSAQTTDQNARLSALSIRGRQLSATVQLIKALGGGWSVPPEMAPAR